MACKRRPLLSTEIGPTPTPTDSLRVSHKSEEVVLQLPLHVSLRSLWTAIVKSVRVGKSLGVGSEKAQHQLPSPVSFPLMTLLYPVFALANRRPGRSTQLYNFYASHS